MVRLKGDRPGLPPIDLQVFQFHNGSIKRNYSHLQRESRHSFQFHNGSIKRQQVAGEGGESPTFQFHNGSIKSVYKSG